MDWNSYLLFLRNDFLFSLVIVAVAFIVGWLFYNHIIIRNICLKDALFEKDNLAAWIEFMGGFVFPVLYLSSKAIEGASSENIFVDLLICALYAVGYIIIFTLLRLMSGLFIKMIGGEDAAGKIELNNEIYVQKNNAAALFSVAISVALVSIVRFLDVSPLITLMKVSVIVIFTLIALLIYMSVMKKKTSLFKEIFIDDNPAAGASFVGFIFAIEIILTNIITLQVPFDYYELIIVSAISLLIFSLLSAIFKILFTKVLKVDIWSELFEQNSIGAAIGQVVLYVGIANVIIHFIK